MKILLVIDSLGSGGAQRQFVNVANGIAARHEVTIFLYNSVSDFYRGDLVENIPVVRAQRSAKKGFSVNVLRQLIIYMRCHHVTLSFLPAANIYCAIAGVFSPGTRHISCEMSVINETESRLRRFIANTANRMSSHVVCNSSTQAKYMASQPGMRRKVSAVWNGCRDMPFIQRPPVNARDYSMLVVGRVAYPKNGVRLLQALQLFHDRNGFLPRVSWAGRDDDSDARSVEMKRQMIAFLDAHLHVKDRVYFLGEVSSVDALYAQSDALLSVSIYEGMPVVICEAMLSGCPVIASNISDNSIIMGEKEERGFLCNPLDPADIASAIERRLSATPEAMEQMVLRARTFAKQKFSIDRMVTQYNRIIESAA